MTTFREEGSMTLVAASVIALLLMAALTLAALGRMAQASEQAVAAAEAAALAAAPLTFGPLGLEGTPETVAAATARANGADLVSCLCRIDDSWETRWVRVVVTVPVDLPVVGDTVVKRSARAKFEPVALLR